MEDSTAEEITLLTGPIGADVQTINQKPIDITLLQVQPVCLLFVPLLPHCVVHDSLNSQNTFTQHVLCATAASQISILKRVKQAAALHYESGSSNIHACPVNTHAC